MACKHFSHLRGAKIALCFHYAVPVQVCSSQRLARCGLTLPSSGHAPAGHTWPSFHSGPSVSCRREPLMSNVRRRKYQPSRTQSAERNRNLNMRDSRWVFIEITQADTQVTPLNVANWRPSSSISAEHSTRSFTNSTFTMNWGSPSKTYRVEPSERR